VAYNKNCFSNLHLLQRPTVKSTVATILVLISIYLTSQVNAADTADIEILGPTTPGTDARLQDDTGIDSQVLEVQDSQPGDAGDSTPTQSIEQATDSQADSEVLEVQDSQPVDAGDATPTQSIEQATDSRADSEVLEVQDSQPGDAGDATPTEAIPDLDLGSDEESQPLFSFSDIHWGGYFKNETAFRYKVPRNITKIRNIFSLDAGYTFNSHFSMFFSGWTYYDLAYDIYDYNRIAGRLQRDSTQPLAFIFNLNQDKDSLVGDVRELYLDMSFSKLDVRIGRQFVVWGLLEGVRVVDEINPIDFRELILPDLLDYRIPLWMLKLDYYRKEGTWQFLWIPDIRFHKPAPPGSEWELLQEVPGTVYPDSNDPDNWEYGLRLSTHFWNTDFTFSYFYTWDDFQVVFRNILLNEITVEPEFLPRYTRITMYGTTINKQIGNYILKGELAYVKDKYFAVANIDRDNDGFLDSQGEFQRDHIRWGLGVEFNLKGFDIAPGITQWVILDYDPAIIQDHYDTSFNLFIRKPMPKSSMLFEFLAIDFITLKETYINPEWTFMVTDRFHISTGLDIFNGQTSQFGVLASTFGQPSLLNQRSQFIGNFHDNDRVYVEFKYSF